jgi:hypothetical protein
MKIRRTDWIAALAAPTIALPLSGVGDVAPQDKPFAGVNLRMGTLGGPWTDAQKVPKMEAMGDGW